MDHTKVWSFFMNVDYHNSNGALAQLGERLVRNQKVTGSNPASSTKFSCLSLADTNIKTITIAYRKNVVNHTIDFLYVKLEYIIF